MRVLYVTRVVRSTLFEEEEKVKLFTLIQVNWYVLISACHRGCVGSRAAAQLSHLRSLIAWFVFACVCVCVCVCVRVLFLYKQ